MSCKLGAWKPLYLKLEVSSKIEFYRYIEHIKSKSVVLIT